MGKRRISTTAGETFQEFASHTSVHGFKYLVDKNLEKYERGLWLLIITSSLCAAGYMTVLFWERYSDNPTRTTIKAIYAPVASIPYPGVTICNVNNVLKSKLDKFLSTLDATDDEIETVRKTFRKLRFSQQSALAAATAEYNHTELEVVQDVLKRNDFDSVQRIVRRVSQSCPDMIQSCAWNKNEPCAHQFRETFTANGLCCSFNYVLDVSPDQMLKNPQYGTSSGLTVTVKPAHDPVTSSLRKIRRVKVMIHSSGDYPGIDALTKVLSAGELCYLQLKASKRESSPSVKSLTVRQRKCVFPNERTLKYFKLYTDSNCFMGCLANQTYKHCGCVPYYYDYTDKPSCNLTMLPCLQHIKSSTHGCYCPPQCEDESYNVFATSAKLDNRVKSAWTTKSLLGINDTEKYLIINVHFIGNGQQILLRDTITSTIYLLSSFGGVYGLFIGCSIISLTEIFYYVIIRFGQKLRENQRIEAKIHTISSKLNQNRLQKESMEIYFQPQFPFVQ
ncbi:sodium channel protein Nach-like isoform X2 [Cylas formicarius]|uniref:sodium channel protein Nach-like isoform X2 n=1 Tax=Cylas formicarius TaxID=197179 RepID=UPI00295887CD|nr:sodium channel protein Nach-like isoform X2 [Cylas formicarius]